MHCDHQLITTHIYDYIDGKLTPTVGKQVELALSQCDTCQSTYRKAVDLLQISQQWTDQAVPEWHRTEYAVRPRQNKSTWISWSALATSTLAIVMVLFQVQITSSDNGFTIAFGKQTDAQIAILLDRKLNQYKQEQANLLEAKFATQTTVQMNNNKLLVADILEKSREERRDDLSFLITGIQTQRFEDQQKVEKRLAYLADNQIENNQFINNLIETKKLSQGGKNND